MEIAAGRSLESLLEGLYEPVESREFRLKILAEDFRAAGAAVLDSLAEYAKEPIPMVPSVFTKGTTAFP